MTSGDEQGMGKPRQVKQVRKKHAQTKKRPAQRQRSVRAAKKEEVQGMKNGQTWSIDLIVGVIIFMMIIAVFYAFLTAKSDKGLEGLKDDARVVNSKVSNTDDLAVNLINQGDINETKYQELCQYDYESIKALLGVENDFCIYLEENNAVIPCTNKDGKQQAGIGNGKDIILYDNVACGQIIG